MPTLAGMPVPLPSHLTQESLPHVESLAPVVDIRLQAISFFLFLFFVSAFFVRWLWNRGWAAAMETHPLTYSKALLITFAWGMASIVVLTMISGARELMTPGAWQQQGWTYKLAGQPTEESIDSHQKRKNVLHELRFQLFRYAALHNGEFPDTTEELDMPELWQIPEHPGFEFILRPQQTANGDVKILVMEPELDRERLVIMTNGLIGSMTSEDLNRELTRYE